MSEAVITTTTRLLDGLLNREQLQSETGWGQRTIRRREQAGLPYISLGRTKFYPMDKAREWITSRCSNAV